MTDSGKERSDVSVWLWLVLPLTILLSPFGMKLVSPEHYDQVMTGEKGFIENLTVVLLLAAIYFGFRALRCRTRLLVGWFRYWIVLVILGCVYFAGEEMSWGQHYLQWNTPAYWLNYNDQGETNLHNTSALLDQVPRTLLTLGALIGGFLVPVFFRDRKSVWMPTSVKYWLWPTYVCIPAALLANFVGTPEKIVEGLGHTMPYLVDLSYGEIKECFLANFLMLYLGSIAHRAHRVSSGG